MVSNSRSRSEDSGEKSKKSPLQVNKALSTAFQPQSNQSLSHSQTIELNNSTIMHNSLQKNPHQSVLDTSPFNSSITRIAFTTPVDRRTGPELFGTDGSVVDKIDSLISSMKSKIVTFESRQEAFDFQKNQSFLQMDRVLPTILLWML